MKHGQSFKTMAITINGNGTLTGVSVGGLPDGIVDTDMLAASAVTSAKSSGLATINGITMVIVGLLLQAILIMVLLI